jgi:hypothetical protein
MSTVFEIERAVEALPTQDFDQFAAWFDEQRAQRIDASLEKAVQGGKFDAMADQALRDFEAGHCRSLDELIRRA